MALLSVTACAGDPLVDAAREAPGRAGDEESTLLRIAQAAAASGDFAAAAGYYRRAHDLHPRSIKPLIGLGSSLSKLGAHEQAGEAFSTVLEIEKTNREALLGLGNALIGQNRPQLAIGFFETALGIEEEAKAYNGLGVAYDMLGEHTVAQTYYGTGLTLEPGNLSLRNNLGLSLAIEGKFNQAIKILRQAAADPRASAQNRLNLALAYGLAGKTEAAAEIARVDLDESAVRRNLAYYRTLRALKSTKATFDAIGVQGFVPGSTGIPVD